MYIGHFAVGLAVKEANPLLPAWPIILGVCILDLIDGIFLIMNLDHVIPNLSAGPYLFFDLVFIDWDHSLLMAIFWSVLWGGVFAFWSKKLALVAGLSVFSHFLIDLPVHNHDMALYPFAEYHLGFSLWKSWGTWAWIAEGIFSLILIWFSWIRSVGRGKSFFGPFFLMLAMFIVVSPWFSPMKWAAKLSSPYDQLLLGLIFICGFLIPAWLFVRHYRKS